MVVTVKRDQFPSDVNPNVGQRLELEQENNHSILVTVTGISRHDITLDAQPSAGREGPDLRA